MRGNKLEIYSMFLITLIYIIIFKIIVLNKFVNLSLLINALFIFSIMVISIILLDFKKEKTGLLRYSIIQTIIIYSILYYILIYIFGIFFGFLKNTYSLEILAIIKNVYLIIPTLICTEIFRYTIISKSRGNYVRIIITTILLIILDIIMEINFYDFNSFSSIFKFVALSLLPVTARGCLFTYIANKIGYTSNILYRLLFEIPIFILPFFPNLGEYLECVIGIIFPFLLFVKISSLCEKSERIPINRMSTLRWYLVVPVMGILVTLIILVSGLFKYHMIAVGSNSMYPNIKRGDAVIIKKIPSDELNTINEGMILVFRHDNKIILHRVVDILKKDSRLYFTTKGDNNNAKDNFITEDKDVIGIIKMVVPYIGYPTVYLNDLFNAN